MDTIGSGVRGMETDRHGRNDQTLWVNDIAGPGEKGHDAVVMKGRELGAANGVPVSECFSYIVSLVSRDLVRSLKHENKKNIGSRKKPLHTTNQIPTLSHQILCS